MIKAKHFIRRHTLASAALLLTACGGGSGMLEAALGISQQKPADSVVVQSRAAWSFDNVSGGTANNSAFSGWNIQLNSTSVQSGRVGNAVSFDDTLAQSYGVIQTTLTGNNMEFPDNRLSIALWLKPSKVAAGSQYLLLGGAPSGGFKSIFLWLTDGRVTFEMQPTEGGFQRDRIVQSASTLVPAVWTHVAVTYDGTIARVYLNGTLNNTNVISHGIPTPNNRIYVGGAATSEGGPLTFPGMIDELQWTATTLTASEVSTLANVPL